MVKPNKNLVKLFEQYVSEQQGINDAIKLAKQFASAMGLNIVNSPELTGLMSPTYGFLDFGDDPNGDGTFMAQFVVNGDYSGWSWYIAVYPEEKMFTLATDSLSVQMKGKSLELVDDDGWECLYKLSDWKKIKPDELSEFMNNPEGE